MYFYCTPQDTQTYNDESIFKLGMQDRRRCAWLLEMALVCVLVCVCVCLSFCVSTPEGINNQWCDIGHVRLVKQVSWLFPNFNHFI